MLPKGLFDGVDTNSLDGLIKLAGNILTYGLYVAGALSVIFLIIGGFRYVLSGGDPQNTAQAKQTIIYALVGLVLAVAAVAIVNFATGIFG